MAAIFGKRNFFLKLQSNLLRYPVGRKFQRNRSILHGKEDSSKFFFFCIFLKKFDNSKWPSFLRGGKFLENYKQEFAEYTVGRKFRRNRSMSHG